MAGPLPAPAGYAAPVWPDWKAGELMQVMETNHRNWLAFISDLQPGDFSGMIKYSNSKGDVFENSVEDILAHLVNHGTHHRAQIGQELKRSGLEKLPVTDYIFYIRENN